MEKDITAKDSLKKKYSFTEADFEYIRNYGITVEKISRELEMFEKGIAKISLEKTATVGDGILTFSEEEVRHFVAYFEAERKKYSIEKFVPASGAASRMFKFLIEFINDFQLGEETINAYINRQKANKLSVFLVGIEKFPFYDMVLEEVRLQYANYEDFNQDEKYYYFINTLLSLEGFDFANKPKGVLPFHKKDKEITTPIDKHLREAQVYSEVAGKPQIHFTVSEEHLDDFEQIISAIGSDVQVNYSFQQASTDTLAVDMDNNPFRLDDGSLFFRPGGHGALIENLNQLETDIVFIKNIDNVAFNHFEEIVFYKKVLGGLLLQLQSEIFAHLEMLENASDVNLEALISFVRHKLNIVLPKDFSKYSLDNQKAELFQLLNRPIRVCGMVKNEGEPGGGPFWVHEDNGAVSLQIVESSQIDLQSDHQKKIFSESTHFNPVDLVCGLKNFKGEKFNLPDFVNHNAGFIVQKTKNGKDISAYELPGLWNGAMANWIAIFAEVPLVTFNPVKTVNDLLKPAHQHE
ncbi:DUF4301 family protein [Flavobacterium saliperosum]|uniref:DUF4301 domain-containing protein n=1 Tax=Flavobacterium saliperosum TaxID=329186 RepID=A0A1G4VAA2_9FLAO|nr:DUF4301 family protein [Flavobacterium saliperosum]SCX02824.1 protein of unknown function [Flavobacterium saliperosum]